MQAFSAFFMKFCLALNSYNYTMNTRFDMSQIPRFGQFFLFYSIFFHFATRNLLFPVIFLIRHA